MHVTLRQLTVFESVARNLSFTQAAEELFLSQPAVSMQIKQLEQNLEVMLLDRVGKRTYLTESGREVKATCKRITHLLNELETVLDNLKNLKAGKLHLTVASTANYFLPAILAVFKQRLPQISIALNVTNRKNLLEALDDNDVDLVIMGQPPEDRDLEAGVFALNPLVIVANSDHELAAQSRVPLQRLKDEIFLVREQGSGTRIAMERFFHEQGIRMKTGMVADSNEAIKQSVAAGLGLGLLSHDTLAMELQLNYLTILDVIDMPIIRKWHIVHRAGKRLSRSAAVFKDFLLDEGETILGGPDRFASQT
ncbi:MAG TPA: LysR family transcriptional regulator [Gammaproteobacteria bacterium]|nr:LysR family transcriptional regulator [Gammaproteobacteria bacterium]